jgi:hypothetical protein
VGDVWAKMGAKKLSDYRAFQPHRHKVICATNTTLFALATKAWLQLLTFDTGERIDWKQDAR